MAEPFPEATRATAGCPIEHALLVLDASGSVKPFIRIFVGSEDIGGLTGLDTPIGERDEIAIIPAIAGGGPGALADA